MTQPTTLILTGSISIDRIMNFGGRYRELIQSDKLHVLSLSVLIDQLKDSRGGTAANIAYNLALLGEHPTLLGSVGADAHNYISDLGNLGIDVSRIHFSQLPTPTFTVLTDRDNNQVGGFYPGAMSDISTLTLKPWYDQSALVVISANDPSAMEQLVEECISHNVPYIYDLGQQVSNITVEQLKRGLSHASILFVNDYEQEVVVKRSGYSLSQLHSMIPTIITTLGADGSLVNGVKVPALSGLQVVDPTGAGDAFRAGFLYGYLRHWDLTTCAQLGSVVASYTIERAGTQTHTFTLDLIRQKHYSAYGVHLPD